MNSIIISRGFRSGLAVSGGLGILLLVAFYAVIAPTSDIRARIPFLLHGAVAHITIGGAFALAGTALHLAVARLTVLRFAGILAGAAMTVFLTTTGVLARIGPRFENRIYGWGVVAVAAVLFGIVLIHERHQARRPEHV